jgi:hypothetical protein
MEMAMEADQDILHGGQIGKEANILIGAGDSKADNLIRQEAHQRMVIEKNFSLFRFVKTRDAIEKSCFAGAIRPDDAMDALLPNINVEITYGHQPAKTFCHFLRKKKSHMIFRLT